MPAGDIITILALVFILIIIPSFIFLFLTFGAGALSYFFGYLTGIFVSGGIFFFFLLIGIILLIGGFMLAPVFASHWDPKYAKWISYLGVFIIMLSFIYLEVGILSSVIGSSIKNKSVYFMPCDNFSNKGIMDIASCIMLGYFPSGNRVARGLSYYSMWVFSLAVPILIVIYLFKDAVETSGIISNPFYAKIIGIGLGMLAYRGLIVTKLIYVLDFGATGIVLILINFLFMGIIFSKVKNFFNTYQQLEDVIETRVEFKTWRPLLEREIMAASVSPTAMQRLSADPEFRARLEDVVGDVAAGAIFNEMASVKTTQQALNLARKIINRLRK